MKRTIKPAIMAAPATEPTTAPAIPPPLMPPFLLLSSSEEEGEEGDEFVEVLLLKRSAISGELKPFEGVFVSAFPFALGVQVSIHLINCRGDKRKLTLHE